MLIRTILTHRTFRPLKSQRQIFLMAINDFTNWLILPHYFHARLNIVAE